jgi:hypothetical protein
MSQENVESSRRIWDRFLAGDTEGVLAFLDPQIEIRDVPELPGASVYHGHDGWQVGKKVTPQRPAGDATASKAVTGAGAVKLLVRAKREAKKKLNKTGKAKVKAKVTYAPHRRGCEHPAQDREAGQEALGSNRFTKSSAVSATSRQPRSMVSECPRFGILVISVTPGLRFCLL